MEKLRELPKEEQTRRRNLSKRAASLDDYLALEAFDRLFYRADTRYLAGIDEAGRGAIAGPVVAAAVVLPPFPGLIGVRDSKKIRESEREELFSQIVEKAITVGIAFTGPDFIDKNNILIATLGSMAAAVTNLKVTPDVVVVDGRDKIDIPGRVLAVPGGDGKSLSIAAASVVAKVARDRLMRKLHQKHPAYNFLKNKGYGTLEHMEAISRHGLISEHRKSYSLKRIEKSVRMF